MLQSAAVQHRVGRSIEPMVDLAYWQQTPEEMIAVRTIPWKICLILKLIGIAQSKGHASTYTIIFQRNRSLIWKPSLTGSGIGLVGREARGSKPP